MLVWWCGRHSAIRAAEAGSNEVSRVKNTGTTTMEAGRPLASENETAREMPARDELLRLYMSEAAATPLLTAEQEISLARAVGAGTQAAERLLSSGLDDAEGAVLKATM